MRRQNETRKIQGCTLEEINNPPEQHTIKNKKIELGRERETD